MQNNLLFVSFFLGIVGEKPETNSFFARCTDKKFKKYGISIEK